MTTATPSYGQVDTIIASAGTGKTYTLVEDICAAIDGGLAPERLLATTFTKKAAAELAGRIRTALIKAGRPQSAAGLLSARIELGRSPTSDVITEDRQGPTFARAVGAVMTGCIGELAPLAERMTIPDRDYTAKSGKVYGWQDTARRVVDAARSNGIDSAQLIHSAERSIASLTVLLRYATRSRRWPSSSRPRGEPC
jgi:ATP-dependent helicase/nuclease subunit A